jgi:mono/diheme cytochrome c family protein
MKDVLVSVLAGVFLMASFAGVKGAQGSEYDRGKKLYSEKCHICHGINGKGDGPASVAFDPRPVNFTDPEFWKNFSDAMIADTVRKGHAPMPAFDLTSDQIKAIIDYLKHAFKK